MKKVDDKVTELTDKYADLQARFDTYRGRILSEQDDKEIIEIIQEIHDTYLEIHQVAFWVAHRYEWANNIADSHNRFLNDLDAARKHDSQKN